MATHSTSPWEEILQSISEDGRLVKRTIELESSATSVSLPDYLHPELRAALQNAGIDQLYSHQADALEAAWSAPLIVTTATASGKSLCFNLPTLELLCRDPKARALYIYPTKALAQDQAKAINALQLKQIHPAIYDGDTPRSERSAIRRRANLVLTNPDMLHVGILPHHSYWADFFANLAFVVIDEAHTYRGIFGSHMANVLRRLRRVANGYGTTPRFLMTSATIANPLELAERLTGLSNFTLIDQDGAPSSGRELALVNPPLLDTETAQRGSALIEAAEMLAGFTAIGIRTICFINSRKAVELIAREAQQRLAKRSPELSGKIVPYRAGYTPAQRRELEEQLAEGELLGVVTTDALELGIDIGLLDSSICVSFPGTVASLRQMWGRAGRRNRRGLGVWIAGEDALDQFFCRHPEEFLRKPVEAAVLDYESEQIYRHHLLCAAFEAPLDQVSCKTLGPRWREFAEQLVGSGDLQRRGDTFTLSDPEQFPAAAVPLRSTSTESCAIVEIDSGEVIGDVDSSRAPSTVHDGAIYLHMGQAYEVQTLDLDDGQALVKPFKGNWYTQPKRTTETTIEEVITQRETCGVTLSFGKAAVNEQLLGYQRRKLSDHEVISFQSLTFPNNVFATQALWYEFDEELLESDELLGTLHAMEHAQIAVLPLIAMCDRWDIGGLSTNLHPQTGVPTIFIFDGHPGGIGITKQGYERFEQLVADAYRLISECRCSDGCPACIQSPKCGNLNEPLYKRGALQLLKTMLSANSLDGCC